MKDHNAANFEKDVLPKVSPYEAQVVLKTLIDQAKELENQLSLDEGDTRGQTPKPTGDCERIRRKLIEISKKNKGSSLNTTKLREEINNFISYVENLEKLVITLKK